ncbi:MAG: App1 family protein [Burkholderiales bacterium]|jgi:phosphatidate phosphatase APP1|nr:App1 family protein [Burkholderiales bacterium]
MISPPEQKALFDERTWYFRTDPERAKRLRVRMADQIFNLPRTNAPGRTHGAFRVERKWIQWQNGADGSGWIEWTLEAPNHQLHGQKGRAWVIPAKGVSVVSDIDDTIKISNVLDKKNLVRNTFLEPFKAVPGMAEWYQHIAQTEENVFFHYLSASPVQLHPALSGFIEEAQFPSGMLHLRESTSWRTLIGGKNDTVKHKKDVLTHLLTTYPHRQFVLVGDSGEHDPEIYAEIARSHPEQIIAIHIRDVTNEDRTAPRYQQTFSGIDPKIWYIRE